MMPLFNVHDEGLASSDVRSVFDDETFNRMCFRILSDLFASKRPAFDDTFIELPSEPVCPCRVCADVYDLPVCTIGMLRVRLSGERESTILPKRTTVAGKQLGSKTPSLDAGVDNEDLADKRFGPRRLLTMRGVG